MVLADRSSAGEISKQHYRAGHRFIKKLTRQMKGFKSFKSASATLEGIEVAHMIRKQQFETSGQSAFKQFVALAG
jgi:putative transposase